MPNTKDVYQNKALENVSIATIQEMNNFVAPKVFPVVPVKNDDGKYFVFDAGDLLRDNMQQRADSTKSAGMDYGLTKASYSCDRYALHQMVDINTKANQDSDVVTDTTLTKILTQKALIKFERIFQANFFAASKWTGSSTGSDIVASTKWDASGSTPIADVELESRSIAAKCGFKPNVMVVTPAVHAALRSNDDIKDRLPVTSLAVGTEEQMAALFGVSKYLVAGTVYNSANKGATDSIGTVFGTEGCLLVYSAPAPNLLIPSGGYTFASKESASNNWGLVVRKWYEPSYTSDIIEVEFKLAPTLTYSLAGAYFSDVLG